MVRFEWDDDKNAANQAKHGVSFEEASELFEGSVDALEIFDESHSETEDRFVSIGPIRRGLVLVAWTERLDEVIRISLPVGPPSARPSAIEPTWSNTNDPRHS